MADNNTETCFILLNKYEEGGLEGFQRIYLFGAEYGNREAVCCDSNRRAV